MKLPHIHFAKKIVKLVIVVIAIVGYSGLVFYLFLELTNIKRHSDSIRSEFDAIKQAQDNFQINFSEDLFNEHLSLIEKSSMENELTALETDIEKIKASAVSPEIEQLNKIYESYGDVQAKVKRNELVKADTAQTKEQLSEWGSYLINKDFNILETSLSTKINELDVAYQKYLDSLPKPEPVKTVASAGYSYSTIKTEKGTTHGVYLIKLPLSDYKVKTVAAIENDCKDNCPTKTLQQYTSENNAYAGMTGSYACPPDYASCKGKVNSFDFTLYDSNDRKWFNKGALTWFKTGMITFNGSSSKFYRKTSEYDGDSVTAGVSNFPSLLKNGEYVVDDDLLTSYQKVRALRGAIGVGSENIYLVYVNNATVQETAYVMKALGAKNALNLDGGGTAAMVVNGKYVVGPGRGVANAILLIKN